MKHGKIFSLFLLATTALMFAGCYTVLEVRSPRNGGYGYNQDRDEQQNQTPADSSYGDQYSDQEYPDSTGNITNNYYGYTPYYSGDYWYNSPRYFVGLSWSSPFYDPFYWDPYGLWSYGYYPGFYYNAFGYYPYYHNLYYGYGYGNGYGHGNWYGYGRTRDARNLRDNNGSRTIGGRSAVAGNNRPSPTVNQRGTRTPQGGTISRGQANSGNRSYGRGTRTMSRQQYIAQRRDAARYSNSRGAVSGRSSNSGTQQRAPQNSGSYSPAPRSYSPPPAASSRSSSGGGGSSSSRGSSDGGRRGR